MRYLMSHKLFSLGTDFVVKDESGQDRFVVTRQLLSIGHRLTFRDAAGTALLAIQQRLLTFRPTYEILKDGQEVAEVKKQLTFFREEFTIDIPGPDDLRVDGDFLNHEYTITRGGQPVAQVSKQWFSLVDTYGVDIVPGQDDALILACAVIVDTINEDAEHH
ncbi:MAG TPA: LURP-one-related family protein [Ktedonobacterales bacterium]|jgi:uncharacterized protein YxjI|nr:LURP-one-related family protein [Ktedonobacterales bacterium]